MSVSRPDSLGCAAGPGRQPSGCPLIALDPQANITDVYAFISPEGLNAVVQVHPFSEPGDGPTYDRFADDALYSIHITNPTTGQTVIRYDFEFSDVNPVTTPGLKFSNTILSYGRGGLTNIGPINGLNDPTRNYTQTYTVKKDDIPIGTGITPPPNIGFQLTPGYNEADPLSPNFGTARSGATTSAQLDAYTLEAIQALSNGDRAFAGPREDGFYADIPPMAFPAAFPTAGASATM